MLFKEEPAHESEGFRKNRDWTTRGRRCRGRRRRHRLRRHRLKGAWLRNETSEHDGTDRLNATTLSVDNHRYIDTILCCVRIVRFYR